MAPVGAAGAEAQELQISGDGDLLAQAAARGWPGDGSEQSPITISGLQISFTGARPAIRIEGTRLHVLLQDISVRSATANEPQDGILLAGVENVVLRNVRVETGALKEFRGPERHSVKIVGAQGVAVDGLVLRSVTDPRVGPPTGVRVEGSNDVTLSNASIFLSPSGLGYAVRGIDSGMTMRRLALTEWAAFTGGTVSIEDSRLSVTMFDRAVPHVHGNSISLLGLIGASGGRVEENDLGCIHASGVATLIARNLVGAQGPGCRVSFYDSDRIVFRDNEVAGTTFVTLDAARNLTLEGNTFTTVGLGHPAVVHGQSVKGVVLAGNVFHPSPLVAVNLTATRDARVLRNVFSGAGTALVVDDGAGAEIRENSFRGGGGIKVHGTSGAVLAGNRFEAPETGILVERSANLSIASNLLQSASETGILVERSADLSIRGNLLQGNAVGVFLALASNVTVHANRFAANRVGLEMFDAGHNLVYDNYFWNEHNVVAAWSPLGNLLSPSFYLDLVTGPDSNEWSLSNRVPGPNIVGGPWIAGNYWHDYNGTDLNGDGLGEVPHGLFPYRSAADQAVSFAESAWRVLDRQLGTNLARFDKHGPHDQAPLVLERIRIGPL